MSVRERFIQLMEEKNFSQTQFGKASGYTANAVNKFITGKTQLPKQDFFEAVHKAWPDVSLNWLILGKGPKYLSKGFPEDLGPLPDPVDVAELTRYKGPSLKDNNGDHVYVTKEELKEELETYKELFDGYMDKIEHIVKWYIQKELIPKVREFDPEAADEAEELFREIEES